MEERYIPLAHINEADIKVVVSGNIIIIYVNDTALATLAYGYEPGSLGLFVEHGKLFLQKLK